MDLDAIYQTGTRALFAIAAIAFPVLFFITVPYGGRHTSERWGPSIPSWLAWLVMELPAPIALVGAYLLGRGAGDPVSLFFVALFVSHYVRRAILDPIRMRGSGKRTPVLSAAIAFATNCLNGAMNGLALSHAGAYGTAWLFDPRFALGVLVFATGAVVNVRSDAILRGLRSPGEAGYRIPHGGLYRWVSCPNYLGEIVQWAGWALATWSAAGLGFLALSIANLAPRARAHQRWYHERFPDYPARRKALVPFVW